MKTEVKEIRIGYEEVLVAKSCISKKTAKSSAGIAIGMGNGSTL